MAKKELANGITFSADVPENINPISIHHRGNGVYLIKAEVISKNGKKEDANFIDLAGESGLIERP